MPTKTNLVLNEEYNIHSTVCKDRTNIALVEVIDTDRVTS